MKKISLQTDILQKPSFFPARQLSYFRQILRRFHVYMLAIQWLVAIELAVFLSPSAYQGLEVIIHPHVWLAAIAGGLITFLSVSCNILASEWKGTEQVCWFSQIMIGGLLFYLVP